MARRWTKTASPNNQFGSFAFLPDITTKVSFAYWYKAANVPGASYPDRHMIITKSNGSIRFNYYVLHDATNLHMGWTNADSTYQNQAGSYTWDTNWHHCAVAMDWDNDAVAMWVDGTSLSVSSSGLTTVPQTAGQTNRLFGIHPATADDLDATIAEFVLYNGYALIQADVNSLADGIAPPLVRPQNIGHYWSLSGYNSLTVTLVPRELESANSNWMNLSGPTVVDHPRIYHGNYAEIFVGTLAPVVDEESVPFAYII